jgi:hypothetical protein
VSGTRIVCTHTRPPGAEAVAGGEERPPEPFAHRLEHLDRGDLRVAPVQHAEVALDDVDAICEPGGLDACPRELRLRGRDRRGGHPGAVLAGSRQRERPPAAADLEHVILWTERELLAGAPQLAALSLHEALPLVLEDRARVGHRLVEERG